jgi:hypothetical protein
MNKKAMTALPVTAKQWLLGHVASHKETITAFLRGDGHANLTEEVLERRLPYGPNVTDDNFLGIVPMLLKIWAEEHPAAFHFLRKVIAHKIRVDAPIRGEWRDFHAGIVDGTILPPRGKKGRPAVYERRDELLRQVVAKLEVNFGLVRLSNPLNRNGESAIEIVKEVFEELCPGLNMVELKSIEQAISRKTGSRNSIIAIFDRADESTE